MNAKGPQTKQMTISPRFFKKERDNYSDWAEAFWRELLQNAVDAGSKNIRINLDQTGPNSCVEIEDDGSGMTEEVMEDVYFSLGETTKLGDETIGGFGRARIITCFAHHQYELWSKDWYVVGQGSEYTTSGMPNRARGLKARIHVDATGRHGQIVYMENALLGYLSKAQLSCNVFVNGTQWNDWCHKRRLARTLSFGNVHTNNKGAWKSRLIVRVQGVPMFMRYIHASAQVIVEIDQAKWREVLLSNRDSLTPAASDELDAFIQILAIDKTSALRSHASSTKLFGPGPLSTSRRRKAKKTPRASEVALAAKMAVAASGAVSEGAPGQDAIAAASTDKAPPMPGRVAEDTYEDPEPERLDEMVSSAMIYVDTQNPRIRAILSKYNPHNWKKAEWSGRPGKPYMVGRTRMNLLRLWTAACDEALQIFLDMIDQDEISWIPGFCFSDDAEAMHKLDGGAHALLFCPVNAEGKMRFHLSQKDDWCRLILGAAHEVVHTLISPHDENYANYLTNLAARVLMEKNAIFRRFRAVLSREKKK